MSAKAPAFDSEPMSQVGYLLRRAQYATFGHFNRTLEPLQLRPAQFSLLELVAARPGIVQTRAAELLGIQKANFVPFVASLEERGLLIRAALDGRTNGLRLTRKGSALLQQARPLVKAHEAAVTAALTASERRQFQDCLRRVTLAAEAELQKVV